MIATAKDPHYQCLFFEFIKHWLLFDGDVPVTFYSPKKNHYNSFIKVKNNNLATIYTNAINWDSVISQTTLDASVTKNSIKTAKTETWKVF